MALFAAKSELLLWKINITSLKEKHSDEVIAWQHLECHVYFCTVILILLPVHRHQVRMRKKKLYPMSHFKEQRSVEHSDIKLDGKHCVYNVVIFKLCQI